MRQRIAYRYRTARVEPAMQCLPNQQVLNKTHQELLKWTPWEISDKPSEWIPEGKKFTEKFQDKILVSSEHLLEVSQKEFPQGALH